MITTCGAIDQLGAWAATRPSNLSTGVADLDDATDALAPGLLWLITATPGQGRSTLATQLAYRLASSHRRATHLISGRDPAYAVAARLLSCAGSHALTHLREDHGNCHDPRLSATIDALTALPLCIADPDHPSPLGGESYEGQTPEALVVDDAHLCAGAHPTRLADLARQHLTVIATVPRHHVTTPQGLDPRWADPADVILDIDRPDLADPRCLRPGEADLHLLRNRTGPTRTVTVGFQGHYSRFVELST